MGTVKKMSLTVESDNGLSFKIEWDADRQARTETLGEEMAKHALDNHQWAEALIVANERINDADWRTAQLIDTF